MRARHSILCAKPSHDTPEMLRRKLDTLLHSLELHVEGLARPSSDVYRRMFQELPLTDFEFLVRKAELYGRMFSVIMGKLKQEIDRKREAMHATALLAKPSPWVSGVDHLDENGNELYGKMVSLETYCTLWREGRLLFQQPQAKPSHLPTLAEAEERIRNQSLVHS
jgi:hypothetical protein